MRISDKVFPAYFVATPIICSKNKIYVAEIDFDLLNCLFDNSYEFKAIAKFPTVERDLAVVVEEAVTAEQISIFFDFFDISNCTFSCKHNPRKSNFLQKFSTQVIVNAHLGTCVQCD